MAGGLQFLGALSANPGGLSTSSSYKRPLTKETQRRTRLQRADIWESTLGQGSDSEREIDTKGMHVCIKPKKTQPLQENKKDPRTRKTENTALLQKGVGAGGGDRTPRREQCDH